MSDAEAPVVGEICRRLDGVALAIELAAAEVEAVGLAWLAAHLAIDCGCSSAAGALPSRGIKPSLRCLIGAIGCCRSRSGRRCSASRYFQAISPCRKE